MTHASHELALCLINENTELFPYERRLEIARQAAKYGGTFGALQWCNHVRKYARWYNHEYHATREGIFDAEDILLAAAELAEYYNRHLIESQAAADA